MYRLLSIFYVWYSRAQCPSEIAIDAMTTPTPTDFYNEECTQLSENIRPLSTEATDVMFIQF